MLQAFMVKTRYYKKNGVEIYTKLTKNNVMYQQHAAFAL